MTNKIRADVEYPTDSIPEMEQTEWYAFSGRPHEYTLESYREFKPMRDTIEYTVFVTCTKCEKTGTALGTEIVDWIADHELGLSRD